MKWGQIQRQWTEYRSQVKQRWARLTDEDLAVIDGRRDVLAARLLELSGSIKAVIEGEIGEFERGCTPPPPSDAKVAAGAAKKPAAAKTAGKKA